jgi:hypothetical protein
MTRISPVARGIPFDPNNNQLDSFNVQDALVEESDERIAEDLTFLKLNGTRTMTGELKTVRNVTIPEYTTVTTNGTKTLTSTSNMVQFFTETTPTGGYSVVLPDATTLQQGWNFELYNRTSNTITVKYNDGSTFGFLSKEAVSSILLQNNSTTNGVWSPFTAEIAQQAAGVISYTLEQTTPFATTSATYVQITSFILVPQSGQYYVNTNMTINTTGNNSTNFVALYKNGVIQTGTERSTLSTGNNTSTLLSTQGVISVNGTDEIRVYVKVTVTSGAQPTMTVNNRSIIALRLGAG